MPKIKNIKLNSAAILALIGCNTNANQQFFIVPPTGYENEILFKCVENNDNGLNRDNCVKHFYDLRTELQNLGHNLKTIQYPTAAPKNSFVISSRIPTKKEQLILKKNKINTIVFLWEPLTVRPQDYTNVNTLGVNKIFTMWDDQVDNKKFFKLYYPHPYLYMIDPIVPFEEKRLLTFISSNKNSRYNESGNLYPERKRAIDYFTKSKIDFVFFGRGWPKDTKCYGGPVYSKQETLKNFKYCICFENTNNMNGYITEKIFDCFNAGCVPIYLGAPNIEAFVPKNCFIHARDFENYDQILDFILRIDEKKYNNYIENIRNFLVSDQAQKFSIDSFVKTCIREVIWFQRHYHTV